MGEHESFFRRLYKTDSFVQWEQDFIVLSHQGVAATNRKSEEKLSPLLCLYPKLPCHFRQRVIAGAEAAAAIFTWHFVSVFVIQFPLYVERDLYVLFFYLYFHCACVAANAPKMLLPFSSTDCST